MKSGVIISVSVDERDRHEGCDDRLLILWTDPFLGLKQECDCSIILPIDIGM